MTFAIFRNLCPNCSGHITAERLWVCYLHECDAVKWVKDIEDAKQQLARWFKLFGAGGIVFVSGELGR